MKIRWFRRFSFLLAVLCCILLLSPQLAAAHGYIVRAVPAEQAVLERGPARVQYWFSETLEPAFSSITVRGPGGTVVAEGGVSETDGAVMSARLPGRLPDGAYIVELRLAFASDGHVLTQSTVFYVGEAAGTVAGQAASNQPVPLEIVWRGAALASLLLLLGTYGLYTLVLVPAWGNAQYSAGLLPPRVMVTLNRMVWGALTAALLANILALLQQTSVFFGVDLVQAARENLWHTVRTGTRFGEVWWARMLMLALVGALHAASLSLRENEPQAVRAFWSANLWVLMLAIGTLSVSSHAAGAPVLPWIAVVSDWMHALASGYWVGALAALVLILPVALKPYRGDSRRLALLAALNRFSPIATVCLFIVIATGFYNSANWVTSPADVNTPYALMLAVKIVMVLGLVLLGALHHAALRPTRYTRFASLSARVRSFMPTLRLEAVFALLVVFGAGLVSATPPPVPPTAASAPLTHAVIVGAYEIQMTLTPGGPGVNSTDIQLTRDGQPVSNVLLRIQWVNPLLDQRGDWHPVESIGDGLYVAAGADITAEGEWLSLIDVQVGDAAATRAAVRWPVDTDSAVQTGRTPSVINLLALAAVVGACGMAVMPAARRVYRQLDLNAANVTIAVSATFMTSVVLVGGLLFLQEQDRQYQASLNPPPARINVVLPDAASLERGEALLVGACGWDMAGTDGRALVERLPRTRDEVLYSMAADGWRGLPACASVSENGLWDIVNALRSREAG